MGLRLGSSLRTAQSKPNLGFDLSFTPGKTYNLDELIELRNRTSSTSALVIEVKYEGTIANKILNRLVTDTTINILTTLNEKNSDLKNTISKIIRDTYNEYGIELQGTSAPQLTDKVSKEMTSKVDRYLRFLLADSSVSFKVYPEDNAGLKYTVTYDFSSREIFNDRFIMYYNKYATHYQNELKVAEGGLAISDKNAKINVGQTDYKNYLLTDESTVKYDVTTDSKPVVVWTDATIQEANVEEAQLTDIVINHGVIKNTVIDESCTINSKWADNDTLATTTYVEEEIKEIKKLINEVSNDESIAIIEKRLTNIETRLKEIENKLNSI